MIQNQTNSSIMKEFYEKYVSAANTRDYEAIAKIVAEDVLLNGKMVKRSDIVAQFKILIDAIPDLQWTVEKLFIDGEEIGARLRDQGRPIVNSFFGENLKQKSVEFTEFASYRIENGQFVEMWFLVDISAITNQIAS